jgi:hypothetical protein
VDVSMNMVTHGFTAGIAEGLRKLAERESLAALNGAGEAGAGEALAGGEAPDDSPRLAAAN